MGLRESGIKLIAQGAEKFINDMGRAATSQDKLNLSAKRLEISFNTATASLIAANQRYVNAITKRLLIELDETHVLQDLENAQSKEEVALYRLIAAQQRLNLVKEQQQGVQQQQVTPTGGIDTSGVLGSALGGLSAQGGLLEMILGGVSGALSALGGPAGLAAAALAGLAIEAVRTHGVLGALWEVIGNVTHVNAMIAVLQKYGEIAKSVFDIVIKGAEGAVSAIGQIISVGKSLVSTVAGWLAPIASFAAKFIAIFGGLSLYGVITNLKQQISATFGEIIDALGDLQKRFIQFTALAARDMVNASGGVITFSKAMESAGQKAQVLFDWVRNLAVLTPFTVNEIADSLAMANAMGMNIDMAKQLTVSVGNFSAGMGLTGDHMYRIIYNMGQMVAMGKLTGREFRDLANSFVPVFTILNELKASMPEWANKSTEAFRKFAMEGGVPVVDFIKMFIKVANRDFPDAMEKMAKTWQGVTNNLKDFLNVVLGFEVFGPAFDKFTAMAANALSKLLSPEFREVSHVIGEVLSHAFDVVSNIVQNQFLPALKNLFTAITGGTPSVNTLYDVVVNLAAGFESGISSISKIIDWVALLISGWNEQFSGATSNAQTWGTNIVIAFANGIYDGLVYVVNAITAIVNWITSQLQAFSPPKALPDLTKWGAAAVAAYMEGWTQIDFTLFKDIAGTIEGYLRGLGANVIPEKKLVPLIQNMRKVVSQAVEEIRRMGEASAGTINKIMSASKYLPANFRTYIKALIDVEKATYAVKNAQTAVDKAQANVKTAQDALNVTTDKYSKILDELNKQLSRNQEVFDDNARLAEINAAINTGLLTSEEKARLEVEKRDIMLKAQIRTVEDQRDAEVSAGEAKVSAAEAALELVQKQLDAAELQKTALEDYLDAQKSLIDVQEEDNKLIQEQIDLLKRLADAAKAAGAAGTKAITDVDAGLTDMTTKFKDLIANDPNVRLGFTQEQAMEWKRKNETTLGTIGGLKTSLDTLFSGMETSFNTTFDKIKTKVDDFIKPGGTIDDMVKAFQGLGEALTSGKDPEVEAGGGGPSWLETLVTTIMDACIKVVSDKLDELKKTADTKIDEFILGIVAKFGAAMLPGGTWLIPFQVFYDLLVGESIIPELLDEMYKIFDTRLSDIATNIGTWITNMIQKFIDSLPLWLKQGADMMYQLYLGLWNGIFGPTGIISQINGWILDIIAGFISAITSQIRNIWDIGARIMDGIKQGIINWFKSSDLIAIIKAWILSTFKSASEEESPSKLTMGVGKNLGLGLAIGIMQSTGAIGNAINSAVNGMQVQAVLSANTLINAPAVSSPSIVNNSRIDRSVHIEVNPSYKNYQSSASVYYDVAAALAAAGR